MGETQPQIRYLIGDEPFVTTRDAAGLLGLHPGTLVNQRAAGRSPIPYFQRGRLVLYPLAEVERYRDRR